MTDFGFNMRNIRHNYGDASVIIVLTVAEPEAPQPAGQRPTPHNENCCFNLSRTVLASLLSVVFLFLVASVRAETNAPAVDKLFFRNGDSLTGRLLSFDLQNGIQWARSDASEIRFHPTNIIGIDLGAVPAPAPWPTTACRARLRGEDVVEGILESCDSNSVRILTPVAGLLTAPRNAVISITIVPPPQSAVYDGPTGLDGWTQGISALAPMGGSQWSYRNGAFYTSKSASIARDLNLPPVASIQFDLRWQTMFQLAVALYADSPQPVSLAAKDNEPPFGAFYSFQLNNTVANLLAVRQGDPQRAFEPAMVQMLSRTNLARVDLRVNKPSASVSLLLDGALVKEWIDPTGFIGQGTMVRFVSQGMGAVKISNIRISQWDGVLDEKPPVNPDGKQDALRLNDDSLVLGDLMAIENGKITVSNAQGIAEIPLARLKQLDFARLQPARNGMAPATVRVFFGQSGRLTIQLDQYDCKTVHGINANLGKIQIDAAAVTRFQMLHR